MVTGLAGGAASDDHLTVEAGPAGEVRHGHAMPAALLHGVPIGRFAPVLPAHGWVVGLHLVPGAVFDLTGTPAATWTGRVVPWLDAWAGWDLTEVWEAGSPAARVEALRTLARDLIGDRAPSPDGRRARAVAQLVRDDRGIDSVQDLAARMSTSERHLQRLCRDHLGVSPRWLLRRSRVLDAHELLSGSDLELSEIAQRLGWFDQAHFTRDYTMVTGVPPARLRRILDQDRSDGGGSRGGAPPAT
ncbi:helix-turn-helix domain-containing protein [Modestobacter sp. URMC 112]